MVAAAQQSHHADLVAGAAKLNERTGNVYENKGPAKKANHPSPLLNQGGEPRTPSLTKQGNRELPSSGEEGVGGGAI